MQFRIGARDPVTGLYQVIHPDGTQLLNGIKIFNAVHKEGDLVSVTQRSDGMAILNNINAKEDPQIVETRSKEFGVKPIGYLQGQVFNNEDEEITPIVSIEFEPLSQSEIVAGQNQFFNIRISVNKAQRKDLKVIVAVSGTATSSDYSTSFLGLDSEGNLIVPILGGRLFQNIRIYPIKNPPYKKKTIILQTLRRREYKLSNKTSVTATIKPPVVYRYTVYVYKDIVRSLLYNLRPGNPPPQYYSYTEATTNAGISTYSSGAPLTLIGALAAPDYSRFNEPQIRFQQFAARMYTPVYTIESPIEELPYLPFPGSTYIGSSIYDQLVQNFFKPADQSPDIDLAAYRYLTGLSTSPAGNPCPANYITPLPLINSSEVSEMIGITDFPAPYVVSGDATYWVHFIVDPGYREPQRNFTRPAALSYSFTKEIVPPIV